MCEICFLIPNGPAVLSAFTHLQNVFFLFLCLLLYIRINELMIGKTQEEEAALHCWLRKQVSPSSDLFGVESYKLYDAEAADSDMAEVVISG